MKTKKCSKCGEVKPVSGFNMNSSSPDKLQCYCRDCQRLAREQTISRNIARQVTPEEKACTKCGVVLKSSNFHKKAGTRDGLNERCRGCYSKENKKRYHADIEASRKAVREANARAYATPEGKARLIGNIRRWERNNPDALKAIQHSRRAENIGKLDPAKWRERLDFYGGKCIYCGTSENITIEHRIPVSRGGTNLPANLAPACKSCNCKKSTKTEFEFKALLSKEN